MSKPTLLFRIIFYLCMLIIVIGGVLLLSVLFPPPEYGADAASSSAVIYSDVICAQGYPGDCPWQVITPYTVTQSGDLHVEWFNESTGGWQPNETSSLVIHKMVGSSEAATMVGACTIPQDQSEIFCDKFSLSVTLGDLVEFVATHESDQRQSGSHRQKYVLAMLPATPTLTPTAQPTVTPTPQPTPVVTATWDAPTPTPPAPGTNGCFAVEPNLTYYCIFIPITFEIGPDWATFGQGE